MSAIDLALKIELTAQLQLFIALQYRWSNSLLLIRRLLRVLLRYRIGIRIAKDIFSFYVGLI